MVSQVVLGLPSLLEPSLILMEVVETALEVAVLVLQGLERLQLQAAEAAGQVGAVLQGLVVLAEVVLVEQAEVLAQAEAAVLAWLQTVLQVVLETAVLAVLVAVVAVVEKQRILLAVLLVVQVQYWFTGKGDRNELCGT